LCHHHRPCALPQDRAVTFDPHNPAGAHSLQLSDPYEYMIAHTLLEYANRLPSMDIVGVTWQPGGRGARSKVKLVRGARGGAAFGPATTPAADAATVNTKSR
jgi:hypothetical protein